MRKLPKFPAGLPKLATLAIAAIVATLLLVVAAGAGAASPKSAAGGGPLVGLLLPENVTARWEGQDRPRFTAQLKKLFPSAVVESQNALNDVARQQQQAEALLAKGAKVLVIAAIDQKAAARIVALADRQNVPVIAYDRLIKNAKLDGYVSFDGVAVGKAQGRWLRDHTKQGDRIVVINGSATDDNAHLFKKGYDSILNPLFASGQRVKVADQFVPGWEPTKAQAIFEQILTKANNDVQGVLSANDGMAGGIIAALRAQGLAGKVPVTGQDATVEGLQRVLLGTQGMSVFKDIRLQANGAARIAAAYLRGAKPPASTFNAKINNGKVQVPSILLKVGSIDKSNISILIRNGFIKKAALCKGIPAGTGPC